jgi:hypothetical protein
MSLRNSKEYIKNSLNIKNSANSLSHAHNVGITNYLILFDNDTNAYSEYLRD